MAGWFNVVVNAFFPARCVSCRHPGGWWCSACGGNVVPDLEVRRSDHGSLDGTVAGCYFRKPLPVAIKALKYRHTRAIAGDFVRYLLPALERIPAQTAVLVPVPLHPSRLRRRGYNQAALLARALSKRSSLPVREDLHRIRNTPTQTDLHRTERFDNVAEAFEWRGTGSPETVILVDDVLTTGATLAAAADACRTAGARTVWGLTVARRELG